MPDENKAAANEFKEGITRLPQPVTTGEINGWTPTAIGFNAITQGKGLDAPAMRHANLKDVRQGRTRYASLSVKMEMTAVILASGGTVRQAARAIGSSRSAVRRFMQLPEYRERIGELQAEASQKITGRILEEFDRRTSKSEIAKLEVLDLTRIMDRVQPQSPVALDRKQKEAEDPDDAEYTGTLQQIIFVDARTQGEDFPAFTDEDLRLSGGDPSE